MRIEDYDTVAAATGTRARLLPWQDLQLVLVLTRTGSTAAAAAALKVSQSSVSRRLSGLEHRLRTQLFRRRSHGLQPTAEATLLARHALDMEGQAQRAWAELMHQRDDAEGHVRLRATEGVALLLLPRALVALRARRPRLTVEVEVSNVDSDSLPPTVDIAVLMHRPRARGIVRKRVARWPLGAYAHERLLRGGKRVESGEAAAQLPWLGFDRLGQLDALLRRTGIGRTGSPTYAVRTDSHLLRWHALRAGLGMGVVPCWLAESAPELRAIDLGVALPAMEVWLVAPEGLQRRPQARAVFEAVGEALASPDLDSLR